MSERSHEHDAGLRELARRLDDDAQLERDVMEEARRERAPDAEARAAAFLRERFAERASEAPVPPAIARSNPLPWIAAAALVIGLSVWLATRAPAPSGPSAPTVLGSTSVECLAPKGAVDAFREFTWRGTLPPGGWYEIEVHGDGARFGASHLEESRWSPSDEERARLPASIRWTVRTMDATGSRVGSCTSSASLSR